MSELVNLYLRQGAKPPHQALDNVQVAFALGPAMLYSVHWTCRWCEIVFPNEANRKNKSECITKSTLLGSFCTNLVLK